MQGMRLIDIAIVVFSTLTVVCIILAVIRFAWLKRKERTTSDDEERALRRWQDHRPEKEPRIDSTDEFLP